MRLLSFPRGLGLALGVLFLGVPLAAIEVILFYRAPWWRLPWVEMAWAAALAFLIWAIIAFLTLRLYAVARHLTLLVTQVWFLASVVAGLLLSNVALAFFSTLILIFSIVSLALLRREMSRSFLDPQVRWYEGRPKAIGGLRCRLRTSEQDRDCRVSRLDTEGVFVYTDDKGHSEPIFASVAEKKRVDLDFEFRGVIFRCGGRPVAISGASGVGFRFQDLSADHRKELGDFVESLRGEGYVQ